MFEQAMEIRVKPFCLCLLEHVDKHLPRKPFVENFWYIFKNDNLIKFPRLFKNRKLMIISTRKIYMNLFANYQELVPFAMN